MPQFQRDHIILNERTEALPYTSPNLGRSRVIPRPIGNREAHGENVALQLNNAVRNRLQTEDDTSYTYVVIKSSIGDLLDIDKLDKGDFSLASYKIKSTVDQLGTAQKYYEAVIRLNRRAVSQFLNKIEKYINEDTLAGNPKNQSLIANIEEIRAATLESFWQEPELAFPELDIEKWWEVWLSRDPEENSEDPIATLRPNLTNAHIVVGDSFIKFPEHWVYLMKGTANQLGSSLLYSNKLAEIREPRSTADFFTGLEKQEQTDWIQDLANRVDHHDNPVVVCLLDTGIYRQHPLLVNLVPERHLDSVNSLWTTTDNRTPYGHGTPMAGLALYGDLSEALESTDRIQIYHHLESVKLINDATPHDPILYGAVTQEAVARGEIINPQFKRIICMAVTCSDTVHRGRPSSWSSAVDQTLFGTIDDPNENKIFFISSGNLPIDQRMYSPLSNSSFSIEDPAQSYNAVTVGSYTLKDRIDLNQLAGATLLANRGGMSPCNTTSIGWMHDWCKKPDIVMEGGNQALYNGDAADPESLLLLSTSRGGTGRSLLTTFGETSASTALASKFAAELYSSYQTLWPETIRALMIHSCDWTPAMLNNRTINQLTALEKERLLAHVGYGVPNLEKARYSANNSLSIIAQRTIQPFKLEDSIIKTNEFHLFDLPWPSEVLQELSETIVRFKITLSYYIEPNPGNKQYELSASYKSHGLRFKMIKPNEDEEAFKGRISRTLREDDYQGGSTERWILGSQLRDKGSVHKDIWEGTAADLATRNKIAIYPIGGWWKNRKKLGRAGSSVRYSLVITIEAPQPEIDIYTPVLNQVAIQI